MELNDKIYPARFAEISESRKNALRHCSRYTCVDGVFPMGRKTILVVKDGEKLHGCCDCFFERVCRAAGNPQMMCTKGMRQDGQDVHFVLWHEEPTVEEKRHRSIENPVASDPEDAGAVACVCDLGDIFGGQPYIQHFDPSC
jgi:hypothetical protein